MKIKSFALLIIILLFLSRTDAQNISAGGFIGGGSIAGFSASTGAFTSSLFAQMYTPFFGFDTRVSFVYAQDFNKLLPGSTNKYFPFMKAVSLKAMFTQPLSSPFYLEEGFGPIVINDRTFSNVSEWNYGVVFSIVPGIDFRGAKPTGIKAGAGVEYAITFGNTSAQYFSFHLQGQYYF